MIEINLIPDVKQELLKAQRVRSMVISGSILASIVAVGAVVLLASYVFGGQAWRNSIADSDITKKGEELAKVEDLSKILTLQNQLKLVTDLNQGKKMNSRVFDMLAAVIPPSPNEAQISQLTVESEGSIIRLEGQTRGFDSMEIFKKTIDAAIITYREKDAEDGEEVKLANNISTTDTSFGEDAEGNRVFRFTLSFEYPEQLFSPSISSIGFKLNINGNATDSYLGIPKTIFTRAASDATGEGQ